MRSVALPIEVSVIIPTRNRATQVTALLHSLAEVRPADISWEVVVIDNGSTDGTNASVLTAAAAISAPVRCFTETEPGLHAGRHRGAREARGEVLAYLDDDALVHPDWLSGARLIVNGVADAVVSRILPKWEAPPPAWLQDEVRGGVYGPLTLLDLGTEQRQIDPGLVWGAGFFIRRSVVFDLGGFHPDSVPAELLRFRGDGESGLMHKFAREGLHAWYDPSSVVRHCVPAERMTVRYLSERYYRQGISDSFSDLRADLDCRDKPQPESEEEQPQERRERAKLTRLLDWAKAKLHRKQLTITSSERARIQLAQDMAAARNAGWDFHRRAVETDPELLRWVRQPTYFDVSIRDFLRPDAPT
jgi:glycosyltransferase involved in cell wall biosynthesis